MNQDNAFTQLNSHSRSVRTISIHNLHSAITITQNSTLHNTIGSVNIYTYRPEFINTHFHTSEIEMQCISLYLNYVSNTNKASVTCKTGPQVKFKINQLIKNQDSVWQ